MPPTTPAQPSVEQVKTLVDQGWPHWWIRPKGQRQWVYAHIQSTRYLHYGQGNLEYYGPIMPPPATP